MYEKIRKWGKKYIPSWLKPYVFRVYFIGLYVFSFFKAAYVVFRIKQEKIFAEFQSEKIVQIIQPTFYNLEGDLYLTGGAERYLSDLSNIIKSLGYRPVIVQFGASFWYIKHEGIDVVGLPIGANNFVLNRVAHSSIFGKPALRIYSPLTFCDPIVDKNSIGISHGIYWDQRHYKLVEKKACDSLLRLSCLVSVDTITLMWFRIALSGKLDTKDLKYIPNYVDLKEFAPVKRKPNKNLIITIPRRLYMQRGYFLVEAVIPNILKKHKNVEFHFVGQVDISVKNEADALLKKYPKNVKIYQQKADKMHEIYKNSDITLIPTVASEGTSLSCLEAMATANPIISTNIGGLPNLIMHRYNGLLISPIASELEDALDKLISDSKLRDFLGKKALETSKAFDKRLWDESWRELLKEKLGKK